jgi:hypothetical protein
MPLMRAFAAGASEVMKFVPRLWAIARELFHEVMGVFFIAFALFFTVGRAGLIHAIQNLEKEPDGLLRLVVVASVVLMLGGFGVSSFLRARRISKGRESR